ncbi:MAG: CHASE2 domain-containing protein [Cyanobacteriota bacterium]
MNYRALVISIALVLILNITGFFNTIDNAIYDNMVIFSQLKSINNDIVIIEIDNKSVKEVGYWPWSRLIYVDLLEKVIDASPKVIGINLSFSLTQGKPDEDQQLYKVLKSVENIIMSTKFIYQEHEDITVLLPEKSLFPEIKKGHELFEEKDIIREFPSKRIIPAFSLYILKLFYENNDNSKTISPGLFNIIDETFKISYSKDSKVSIEYLKSPKILINYLRTPDKFKHYSVVDILNNNYDPEDLKGKIILIGATDKYLSHFFTTPFTTKRELFSSSAIELQAQIIDGLINFRNLRKCYPLLTIVWSIFAGIMFYMLTKDKHFWIQGLVYALMIVIICSLCFIFFKYFAFWLPPVFSLVLVSVIFSFHIYFTVTRIDTQLIKSINSLKSDENIPLVDVPANVNDKVEMLNSLINIISSDRQTIKTIMNGVKNGITVIDGDGKITWANQYMLDTFKDSLVLNHNINNVIPELSISEIKENLQADSFLKKEIDTGNKEFYCIISEIVNIEKHYVLILNDITELKEIDRLKTDIVRILSHELKTPIMNISIATENIYDFNERDIILQSADHISKYTELMTNIIQNFLNLNQLENNLMQARLAESDLTEVAKNCIELQKPLANKKNINLIIEADAVKFVLIDYRLIEIVFNNLISNAIKYSQDNSNVIVKLVSDKEHVIVSIIDSGIGISEDEIEHIFEKFFRASNNEHTGIKGTGLGLSIVKKIIELHGGEINVYSEPNKGTIFTFKLPVIK